MEEILIKAGAMNERDIKKVLAGNNRLVLDDSCIPAIDAAAALVSQVVDEDKTVYGVNTGFGLLADRKIATEDLKQLQRNIVLSHACGTGKLLDDDITRLIVVLKINSLAQGYSGVRRILIDRMLQLMNAGVLPVIPSKGSVGASGDLVPLAHMAMMLIGEGKVKFQNAIIDAKLAHQKLSLQALELAPKEGLALLNGMQVSNSIALKAVFTTEKYFNTAMISGCLSVEAASASDKPFDERIHRVRGHQAQIDCAHEYLSLLDESEIRHSHRDCSRVQDPYSLRCQPQVMGACLTQLRAAKAVLLTEANAVSDNPLVFARQGEIISGGNFHGEILAMAADNLSLAIAEIGGLAERRIALLIDKHLSGLPAFLVKEGGLNSGFMLAHVTAAAHASDNKALSHPHSVDSLPTSANQEDHVSMATNASLRLSAMLDNTATILAIELLAACQGLEFHKPLKTSEKLQKAYDLLRRNVAPYDQDRYFSPDIEQIKQQVISGDFAEFSNIC